ncbi:response regulator [Segetibacter koreensis]|uniref:response regulator n=1 Tax=Segetibacter koreensis TaxID=398037 RepID=UPI000377ED7B|nr:response regulator [Segetibacter koreensis]
MFPKNIVLYADDDIDDLQLIKEAFSPYSNDVELITVTDGLEAIAYLENIPLHQPVPCLIILDINMPRMDGKEALKIIRGINRFKKVPSILFTTSSQTKDKEFAKTYNAGFLTKPIDYNQLDLIAGQFIKHCTDEVKNKVLKELK